MRHLGHPVQRLKEGHHPAEQDLDQHLRSFLNENLLPDATRLLEDEGGDLVDVAFLLPEEQLEPDPDPEPEPEPDPKPEPTVPVALPQPDRGPSGGHCERRNVGAAPQMFKWPTPPPLRRVHQLHPSIWTAPQSQGQCAVGSHQNTYPVHPPAPPVTCSPKKRKRDTQHGDNQPYIKKPPNAFMLYLKEQRPSVAAELGIRTSAVVNAEVGKRWQSLSEEEKQKYYDQGRIEARLHGEKHPGWSSNSNYAKKRPRMRRSTKTEAPKPPQKPGTFLSSPTFFWIDSAGRIHHFQPQSSSWFNPGVTELLPAAAPQQPRTSTNK